MKVAMIGTGYVGLTSGACFADAGHDVMCIDIDQEKIDKLKQGKVPFYEPGLEEIITRNHKNGRLKFSLDMKDAVKDYDVLFFCLPTPTDEKSGDGMPDLSYIEQCAHEAGKLKDHWGGYRVFVNKSTVPPESNKNILEILRQYVPEDMCDVVSNPEFLKEGDAVDDFKNPDRIVIGCNAERTEKMMRQLYAVHQNKEKFKEMSPKEAELVKYFSNAVLATKISMINEMARTCDKVGANVENVRIGMCSDHRIGWDFFWPSLGWGGSCFPKDVRAIVAYAKKIGAPLTIFEKAISVNEEQKDWFVEKINNYFSDVSGKQFGVWGLSFKPETDDVRESSSIYVIESLIKKGAMVKAYDPQARETARVELEKRVAPGTFEICDKKYDVLVGSDALIMPTEWDEFRAPDFLEIKNSLKEPVIFDGKNIYGRDKNYALPILEKLAFNYIGVACNFDFRKK